MDRLSRRVFLSILVGVLKSLGTIPEARNSGFSVLRLGMLHLFMISENMWQLHKGPRMRFAFGVLFESQLLHLVGREDFLRRDVRTGVGRRSQAALKRNL
jgi:hypothetical protein